MQAVITSYGTEKSSSNNGYIVYKVQVKVLSNNYQWEVSKRYNQFLTLKSSIDKLIKSSSCPPLPKFPPKIIMNMVPSNIQKRKVALQEWMDALLNIPELATANCVQDFFEVIKYTGYALNQGPPPQQQQVQQVEQHVQMAPPQQEVNALSMHVGPMSFSVSTNNTTHASQVSTPVSATVQTTTPDYYAQQPQATFSMNVSGPDHMNSTGHASASINMNMSQPQMTFHTTTTTTSSDPYYNGNSGHVHTEFTPNASISFNSTDTQMNNGFPQMGIQFNIDGSSAVHTSSSSTTYTTSSSTVSPPPTNYAPPMNYAVTSSGMSDQQFEDFIQSFKDQSFSSDKISFIKNEFKNHLFTSEQGLKLLDVCSFSDEYVEAAIALHPRLVDPNNFHKLITVLPFESDRQKVRSALNMA